MQLSRILYGTLLASIFVSVPVIATSPSFDCEAAEGTVQKAICADESLAALDLELDEVWTRAIENFAEEQRPMARAVQRGWIKGRDECWKSNDVAACVRDEYERRITELQIRGGLLVVPDLVAFDCADGERLAATFYQDARRPAAVLTYGDQQVIAYSAPAASGARYEGRNVLFWEHQGEVTLEWNGTETTCRPISSAANASLCDGAPADAAFVIATSPLAGARVGSSFEVAGCSRTFESNVTWRLFARDGTVVAEGFTTGGGVDGPRPFHFTVDAGAASGLHHLEVTEPKITDEGFPPGRTVLPLIVE